MTKTDDASFSPFVFVPGNRQAGMLLICDHASNAIPQRYGNLGMPPDQMKRHIAYDIGAEAVTLGLAQALQLPTVLSTFSRLLIDPNRGADDPTLMMRISDGAFIPGNARANRSEIERRLKHYYEPYHERVADELNAIEQERGGKAASIFSIHSFTPSWRGVERKWQVGFLWDCDPRMPLPMIERLREDKDLTVGDNEPYDGALLNDCMYRHGTSKGRAHALMELRQDLINHDEGVQHWIDRLVPVLREQLENAELDAHLHYMSRAGKNRF